MEGKLHEIDDYDVVANKLKWQVFGGCFQHMLHCTVHTVSLGPYHVMGLKKTNILGESLHCARTARYF